MPEILSHQLKSALDHLDTLGISSAQFVAQLLTQDWGWHHASKDQGRRGDVERYLLGYEKP